jgi:hypothetical protein
VLFLQKHFCITARWLFYYRALYGWQIFRPVSQVLSRPQDGVWTDLHENLSLNSLKPDLLNKTIFNPPIFALVITFKWAKLGLPGVARWALGVTNVFAISWYDYPPPVCGPGSGDIVKRDASSKRRIIQGKHRSRTFVRGYIGREHIVMASLVLYYMLHFSAYMT